MHTLTVLNNYKMHITIEMSKNKPPKILRYIETSWISNFSDIMEPHLRISSI
jgi:hypothetical protein